MDLAGAMCAGGGAGSLGAVTVAGDSIPTTRANDPRGAELLSISKGDEVHVAKDAYTLVIHLSGLNQQIQPKVSVERVNDNSHSQLRDVPVNPCKSSSVHGFE
eukprot:1773332-Pyramimonas_sp.AAC.1